LRQGRTFVEQTEAEVAWAIHNLNCVTLLNIANRLVGHPVTNFDEDVRVRL